MNALETPWDSFEERNLVLQGLLGLVSAVETATAFCATHAAGPPVVAATEPGVHPLVFLLLGLVSFRDSLRGELDPELRTGSSSRGPALHTAQGNRIDADAQLHPRRRPLDSAELLR
jgi:hypothetical protein